MKNIFIILILGSTFGCVKETIKSTTKKSDLPVVKTIDAVEIFSSQASVNGIILSEGSSTIISKGICWSTLTSPTILNFKTNEGAGASNFNSIIKNLNPNTIYYYRAYATNNSGTSYGLTLSFKTPSAYFKIGNGIVDIEGNKYQTIHIGNELNGYQEWMAEDLKSTKLNDGTLISNDFNDSIWEFGNFPQYRYYNNNPENKTILYNFFVIKNNNICPAGWHVPKVSDWEIMLSKIGNDVSIRGNNMKNPGNIYWESTGGTNLAGFNGFGTGYITEEGNFINIQKEGVWWTSDETNNILSKSYYLLSSSSLVQLKNNSKHAGLAIRCVKN